MLFEISDTKMIYSRSDEENAMKALKKSKTASKDTKKKLKKLKKKLKKAKQARKKAKKNKRGKGVDEDNSSDGEVWVEKGSKYFLNFIYIITFILLSNHNVTIVMYINMYIILKYINLND